MATCLTPSVIRTSSSDSDLKSMSRISVAGFRDGKAIIVSQSPGPEVKLVSGPDFRKGEYQTGWLVGILVGWHFEAERKPPIEPQASYFCLIIAIIRPKP